MTLIEEIKNKIAEGNPVVVDFYAPWCMPCKVLSPVLDKVAEGYGDKVALYKLNIEEYGDYATENAVRSVPTVILFKGGSAVDKFVGSIPQSAVEERFAKLMAG